MEDSTYYKGKLALWIHLTRHCCSQCWVYCQKELIRFSWSSNCFFFSFRKMIKCSRIENMAVNSYTYASKRRIIGSDLSCKIRSTFVGNCYFILFSWFLEGCPRLRPVWGNSNILTWICCNDFNTANKCWNLHCHCMLHTPKCHWTGKIQYKRMHVATFFPILHGRLSLSSSSSHEMSISSW